MKLKIRQNLVKKEISDKIHSIIGLSSKNIQDITDDVIKTLIEILIKIKIHLKNFGSFHIIFKKKEKEEIPRQKRSLLLLEKFIKFKPSNLIKQKLVNCNMNKNI